MGLAKEDNTFHVTFTSKLSLRVIHGDFMAMNREMGERERERERERESPTWPRIQGTDSDRLLVITIGRAQAA